MPVSESILNAVESIRDQIVADIEEGWQIKQLGGEIVIGAPRVPVENLPYAIIRLDSVPRKFEGVRSVQEKLIFEIVGRFAIPPAPVLLEDYKVGMAQRLGNLLIANGKSAGASLPQIVEVVFVESDDPQYPVFEIGIRYSALVAGVFQ